MLSHARRLEARLLPHGWQDLVRQLLLFAAAYYGYRIVRGMVDEKAGVAAWNATNLIWIETKLHVFVEPSMQAWTTSQSWLIGFASWMYVNSHFVITTTALAWIYLFRNASFYFVRNMFMVAMGIALVAYFAYPTAPPRLMPEWGFTDSVQHFTGIKESDSSVSALLNLYAAVPSMHVGFALMIGIPLAKLVRPRPLKVLWALYPLLVTWVVVVTGNHFVADAFLGALTAGASALIAQRLFARARPGAWAFRPARARASATA